MTDEDLQEEDHDLLDVVLLLLRVIAVDLPGEMHRLKRTANQVLHHRSDLLPAEMVWMIENVRHLEEEIVLQDHHVENHLVQVLHLLVEEIVLLELLELLLMVTDPRHKIERGREVLHQQTKAERRDRELVINC